MDGYTFPAAVGERFRSEHPELHPEDTALVETAARQWFRLLAGQPGQQLALPSRAVADHWLAFVHVEGAYRQFCDEVLGGFVAHRPPPSGPGEGVADGPGLLRTLKAAERDEPDAPHGLPWVFRIDARVKVLNGRRYLRDCGGGPECHSVAGSVCLKHVDPGRLATARSVDLSKGSFVRPSRHDLRNRP